jgi:hypothetical protein
MACVRGVVVASAFVAEEPILGWLDDVFTPIAQQILVPADSLAPGWPSRDTTPDALRTQIYLRGVGGESTDPPWRAVVKLARKPGDDGRLWQLLACGLALDKLKAIDSRYRAATVAERRDMHADLIEGFLSHLRKLDLGRPNVANRLADAGKRNLDRRRRQQRNTVPVDFAALLPHPTATPGSGPHNWTHALEGIADDLAAAGRPLDSVGLELIGRTVIDRQTLAQGAAELGLGVQAAYKRRQRAEARIAAHYRIDVRRPASGRAAAVSPDATEDAA